MSTAATWTTLTRHPVDGSGEVRYDRPVATVSVFYTEEIREAYIGDVQATAAFLRFLGENAKPCDHSGCKRPYGHGGRHYYDEDDVRSISLHDYRAR